jgi:hypothetical protein
MSKAIFDPKTAFMNIIGQGGAGEREARPPSGGQSGGDGPSPGAASPAEGKSKAAAGKTGPVAEKGLYIKRTMYVTKSQFRELKMRAAMSEGQDDRFISTIVRAALDMYFNKT